MSTGPWELQIKKRPYYPLSPAQDAYRLSSFSNLGGRSVALSPPKTLSLQGRAETHRSVRFPHCLNNQTMLYIGAFGLDEAH